MSRQVKGSGMFMRQGFSVLGRPQLPHIIRYRVIHRYIRLATHEMKLQTPAIPHNLLQCRLNQLANAVIHSSGALIILQNRIWP